MSMILPPDSYPLPGLVKPGPSKHVSPQLDSSNVESRVHEATVSIVGGSKPGKKIVSPKKVSPSTAAENQAFQKQAVALMKKNNEAWKLRKKETPEWKREGVVSEEFILTELMHLGLKGVGKNKEVAGLAQDYRGLRNKEQYSYALRRFLRAKNLLEKVLKEGHPAIQTPQQKRELLNIYQHRLNYLDYAFDFRKGVPLEKQNIARVVEKVQKDINALEATTSDRVILSAQGVKSFAIPGGCKNHAVTYEFQKEGDNYYFVINNRGGAKDAKGKELHGSFNFDFNGVNYIKAAIKFKVPKEALMNPKFLEALIANQETDDKIPYEAIFRLLVTEGGGRVVQSETTALIEHLAPYVSSSAILNPETQKHVHHLMDRLLRLDDSIRGSQFYGVCGEANLADSEAIMASGSIRAALKIDSLNQLMTELGKVAFNGFVMLGKRQGVKAAIKSEDYLKDVNLFRRHVGKQQSKLMTKLARRHVEGELVMDRAATIKEATSLLSSIRKEVIDKTTPEFLEGINSLDQLTPLLKLLTNSDLKNNKAFCLKLIEQLPSNFTIYIVATVSDALMKDPEFVSAVLRKKGFTVPVRASLEDLNTIPQVSDYLRHVAFFREIRPSIDFIAQSGTKEEILEIFKSCAKFNIVSLNSYIMAMTSPDLKNDSDFMKAAIEIDPNAFLFASDELKNNLDFVLYALRKEPFLLDVVSEKMRDHPEVVKAAVIQNPAALEFASDQLKNNKAFMLEMIKLNEGAMAFASQALQDDPEFIQAVEEWKRVRLENVEASISTPSS